MRITDAMRRAINPSKSWVQREREATGMRPKPATDMSWRFRGGSSDAWANTNKPSVRLMKHPNLVKQAACVGDQCKKE